MCLCVCASFGVILLLQGRRLNRIAEEAEQCQSQHKTLFLIIAQLITCEGHWNLSEPHLENSISQRCYNGNQDEESESEGSQGSLWAPGSVSLLSAEQRPQPGTRGTTGPRDSVGGEPTVDLLLPLAAIPGAPLSFS